MNVLFVRTVSLVNWCVVYLAPGLPAGSLGDRCSTGRCVECCCVIAVESSPAGESSSMLRLRLDTTLDGQPTLIVEAPPSVNVYHMKVALECHRGIEVKNQSLAVWREGKGYIPMDDTRNLAYYQLQDDDRLFLSPVLRTGPGNADFLGKSAISQLINETNDDFSKTMDDALKNANEISSNICYALVRKEWNEVNVDSDKRSATREKEEKPNKEEQESVKSNLAVPLSDDATNNSPGTNPSTANGSSDSSGSVRMVCDDCGDQVVPTTGSECTRCAGRFCSRHIPRVRHRCTQVKRCFLCHDLVLIAGDRSQCKQCQQLFCRKHIGLPCSEQHHQDSKPKREETGQCPQQ